MLHDTKLLFVGRIGPVAEDPAFPLLRCGDRDAAFVIVAESGDDVIATLPGNQAPQQLIEFSNHAVQEQNFPLRVFFFCRHAEDEAWLNRLCESGHNKFGLASLELEPDSDGGICFVRTQAGMRMIETCPVR